MRISKEKNVILGIIEFQNGIPRKCKLMAVVKAEAYGYGIYEIATHLGKIGVKAFAVATIDEGIKLRQYGVSGEILILGYTAPARAKELHICMEWRICF